MDGWVCSVHSYSSWWRTRTALHALASHSTVVLASPSCLPCRDELRLSNTHDDHSLMLDWEFVLVLSGDHIYKIIWKSLWNFQYNWNPCVLWMALVSSAGWIMTITCVVNFISLIYVFVSGRWQSHTLTQSQKRGVSVTQLHNSLCVLPFLSLLHNSWLLFGWAG